MSKNGRSYYIAVGFLETLSGAKHNRVLRHPKTTRAVEYIGGSYAV